MGHEILHSMKVEELKHFLRLGGFKLTRKKEILVARAFCAIKDNVTLVTTAQGVEAQLKEEYSKKLELKTIWMEDEEGIAYWLIIDVMCILNFLMINSDITELSDYKALKGYSYFKHGRFGVISYL